MRAFVTGANGFLGRHLVTELLSRGHAVRALVRQGSDATPVDRRAEIVRGDAMDAALLRDVVEGCPLVFHLAGIRRSPDPRAFAAINAGATRSLLDACAERGAAAHRFVLAGSLAALGPSREGKREEDPFSPAEWYGASKAEAERIALSFAARLPVSIGRPPRIIGPGDRENLFFFRIVARGFVVRILGPERPLSWIDVADCARGLASIGEHPAAAGETFFLASPESTDAEALQREVARALGVRARTIPIPPAALTAAAWGADAISTATRRKLPLNRKLARQLLAPGWTCRPDKARRLLGFTADTPLSDSVARAALAYRREGLL